MGLYLLPSPSVGIAGYSVGKCHLYTADAVYHDQNRNL